MADTKNTTTKSPETAAASTEKASETKPNPAPAVTSTAPAESVSEKAADALQKQRDAASDDTKKPYYLKPGQTHSYIKDGERVEMRADGKTTLDLTDAQAAAFKDKFQEEAPKIEKGEESDRPATTNEDGMGPQQATS